MMHSLHKDYSLSASEYLKAAEIRELGAELTRKLKGAGYTNFSPPHYKLSWKLPSPKCELVAMQVEAEIMVYEDD